MSFSLIHKFFVAALFNVHYLIFYFSNILRNGYNLNIVGEIVFGINPVTIALDVKRRSFNQLFIKRTTSLRQNKRLTSLEAFARNLNITVHKVETPILNHLSGNRAHQGVCLDAGRLEFQSHIPEER